MRYRGPGKFLVQYKFFKWETRSRMHQTLSFKRYFVTSYDFRNANL